MLRDQSKLEHMHGSYPDSGVHLLYHQNVTELWIQAARMQLVLSNIFEFQ